MGLLQGEATCCCCPPRAGSMRGCCRHATSSLLAPAVCLSLAGAHTSASELLGSSKNRQVLGKPTRNRGAAWPGGRGVALLFSCGPASLLTLAVAGLSLHCLGGSLGLGAVLQRNWHQALILHKTNMWQESKETETLLCESWQLAGS